MSVDIVGENALFGTYTFLEMHSGGIGDAGVDTYGFSRTPSVNVGDTIDFSIHGPGTIVRIFRTGYYFDAKGFREVAQIANTPTTQPEATTIADSNGATSCTGWSVTASWTVPSTAVSGVYLAMVRNSTDDDATYITFVVRDDAAVADVIYKVSDTTWGAAYNNFGTLAAPLAGRNVYGEAAGIGNIMARSLAVSYHRPLLTKEQVVQTFWWACELPLIRFLERNGVTVKYVTSVDLDEQGEALLNGGVFLSSGHDEYWSQAMRDAVEAYREAGGHLIFMSGNEVFWRVEFERVGDETIMWCRKDTMPGPTGYARNAGEYFVDADHWTGTFMDTRWELSNPTRFLTGTQFGANGVLDANATIPSNPYGGIPVWGGSALVDGDVVLAGVVGFEADHVSPTQPDSSYRYLARYTRDWPPGLSDVNGQNYNVVGSIQWGVVSQRFASGAVTIGFGTCQWSWALDGTHDRGSSLPSLAAQQFTVSLLHDLGATAATPMSGVSVRAQNDLDSYGVVPVTEDTGPWIYGYDGTRYYPYHDSDILVPQRARL